VQKLLFQGFYLACLYVVATVGGAVCGFGAAGRFVPRI
jgi:hypothetical protein